MDDASEWMEGVEEAEEGEEEAGTLCLFLTRTRAIEKQERPRRRVSTRPHTATPVAAQLAAPAACGATRWTARALARLSVGAGAAGA